MPGRLARQHRIFLERLRQIRQSDRPTLREMAVNRMINSIDREPTFTSRRYFLKHIPVYSKLVSMT